MRNFDLINSKNQSNLDYKIKNSPLAIDLIFSIQFPLNTVQKEVPQKKIGNNVRNQ